jgi:hypothetical protein
MSGECQREQERIRAERAEAVTPKQPVEMSSVEHFLCDYAVVPEPRSEPRR